MKRYLLFSLLLFLTSLISAQITITNITFPEAGDTLKLAIDNSPTGIVALTPPGGNQIWDFSNLQVDATQNLVYSPANQGNVGDQLPDAKMFTSPTPGTEYYFNVTSTKVELMAYNGPDPYGIGFNALFHYYPFVVERRSPVNFFDINAVSSGLLEKFHPSVFPPAFIAALPVTVDSFRYRIAISRIDAVDAWGSLIIPGGTYEVLREKRTLYRESRLDAKVPPLGWLDITDIAILSGGVTSLGVDTFVYFYFHNDVSKEHIAIVTLNNAQSAATQVMFKNTADVTRTEEVQAVNPSITVSPNPVGDEAVISFKNLVSGNYRLTISDASGRLTQQITLQMNCINPEQINLSMLFPGMYVISLIDEKNRLVCQEKLMKAGS